MEINKQVEVVKHAIEEKKGIDIKVINLEKKSTIADRFIIASGNSSLQVKAIADEIEEVMEENFNLDFKREGYSQARWIVLDYGGVVVHIFHKEEREFYQLERLWSEDQ